MEREIGLNKQDLPHPFASAWPVVGTQKCTCGRPEHDSLHNLPTMQEQATYSGPAFQTEKGS